MAAIESKLAEALTEIKNLREALGKEVEERRRDHDELIRLREWAKTLFKKIEELERIDKSVEQELKILRPLVDKVDELVQDKITRDLEGKRAEKDATKERGKRAWQVWMMVLGAVVSVLLTAILGGWLSKVLFK